MTRNSPIIHFAEDELADRRQRTIEALTAQGLEGLLCFRQESMFYLSGYDTFGYVFFQCLYLGTDGTMTLLTRAPDVRVAAKDRKNNRPICVVGGVLARSLSGSLSVRARTILGRADAIWSRQRSEHGKREGSRGALRFPGLVRQSFIGQVEAGELGVAPFLGDLDGMEDGRLGRAFQIRVIGVR